MIADLVPTDPGLSLAGLVWSIVLAGLAFVAGFVLIWGLVVFLISRIGDWGRLARRYAAGDRKVAGIPHSGVVGWIGIARYRGCLTVTLADDGFFLEVSKPFRVGHPTLFIPWSALGERREKRIQGRDLLACAVGDPPLGVVTLPAGWFVAPR